MNVRVSYDIKVTLKLIFGMKTSRFCHYDIMQKFIDQIRF